MRITSARVPFLLRIRRSRLRHRLHAGAGGAPPGRARMLEKPSCTVKPGEMEIGPFSIEFIHVTHSIVAASRWPSRRRSASSFIPAISKWIPRPPTTSCSICTRWPSTASAAYCCCCRIRPMSTVPVIPKANAPCGPRLEDLFVRAATPPGDFLLQLLHSPSAADTGFRARIRPQSCLPRPQHDQRNRDRARSGTS